MRPPGTGASTGAEDALHNARPGFVQPLSALPRDHSRMGPISASRCTKADSSSPKPTITVSIAEPPWLISGSGTPPTGIEPVTIATLTKM